jgi:MFS family permease
MSGVRRAFVAIAAALALADASIVALALPPILVEFDTTISGVAAIVGSYALVLAIALAAPLPRGRWGMFVFAAASLACAIAPNLWLLLLFRAVQGVGAAAALLNAFEVLHAERSRRLWIGASLIGTAAGPALGGVLTELFDWRAIFAAQVPLALAAALATQDTPRTEHADGSPPWRSLVPLALTAAAFTAVLFLLVLELVAGFAISPIRAALGVSILPLAALAGAAVPGAPRARGLAGAILLAGGAAALAFLPAPTIAWTVVPQLLAGAGMGLALPALSPERDVGEATINLVARHVGIVIVLAILAPVASTRLTDATETAILQGTSLVLDAQIDPLKKLELAPGLLGDVDTDRPRASLTEAVAARRGEFQQADRAIYDRLASRLDDVVVGAIKDAFKLAYLIAAALSLLAAGLMLAAWRRPAIWLAAAAAAGCAVVFAVEQDAEAPPPVVLADPCKARELPSSGGIAGAIQQQALEQLDNAACRLKVPREELALAIFDSDRARKFEDEHGVNPRSVISILSLLRGG